MPIRSLTIFLLLFTSFVPYSYASAVVQQRKQASQQMQQRAYMQQMSSSLGTVWRELEYTSEIWPQITDNYAKVLTVQRYVSYYANQGIAIRKPAENYVGMINAMGEQNPDLLKKPFKVILRIAAVIEYDFDNGTDKDQMALQLLGQQGYINNKQRLGLP